MRNEEGNVEALVHSIIKVFLSTDIQDYEVIIIDDNSTDGTGAIADELSDKHSFIKVIHRAGDPGVGYTLKAGFEKSRGDIIVTLDGDFSHDPEDIPRLLSPIYFGADLSIGSRYVDGGICHMPLSRIIISRAYNLLLKILSGMRINDFTTGYRAVKKNTLESVDLVSDGFESHPELHIKAIKKGFKVVEIPITYVGRVKGKSKMKYHAVGLGYLGVLLLSFKRYGFILKKTQYLRKERR